jgi:hypothetical protein
MGSVSTAALLHRAAPLAVVPLPPDWTGIRCIGEIWTPYTDAEAENQRAELAWFHARGYSGALIVWRGENPLPLAGVARELKADGWRLLLTYGPADSADPIVPAWSDVDIAMRALLPCVDVLLTAWRGTAWPHWESLQQEMEFAEHLATIGRQIAPAMPILGEAFVTPRREVIIAAPECAAGLVTMNVGCENLRPDGILGLIRPLTPAPLMVLILGPRAYWNSLDLRGSPLSADRVRESCRYLENRWQQVGYVGTITLVGDGFGTRPHLGVMKTDALTRTHWRKDGER